MILIYSTVSTGQPAAAKARPDHHLPPQLYKFTRYTSVSTVAGLSERTGVGFSTSAGALELFGLAKLYIVTVLLLFDQQRVQLVLPDLR